MGNQATRWAGMLRWERKRPRAASHARDPRALRRVPSRPAAPRRATVRAMPGKTSKAKGHKIGRNTKKCAVYRARGRREMNRARKLRRHVRLHPGDLAAAVLFKP